MRRHADDCPCESCQTGAPCGVIPPVYATETTSDPTNWTDTDEIALLRGRAAENSSLQAHIVELSRALDRTSIALTAERALTDDLADALIRATVTKLIDHAEIESVLARYQAARHE